MRWTLIAALIVMLPTLAFADSPPAAHPTFYKDSASGCAVGTFYPEAGLAVRWTGPCVAGKAQGRGIAEWSTSGKFASRSEGEYRAGLREGRTIVKSADGTLVEAEYRDGKRDGRCIAFEADGGRFDGRCANDLYNGVGKWIQSNGDRYYGEFRNGKIEGRGIYAWKDGRVYEGEFVAGKREGRGKIITADGSWYQGDYRNDKADGDGVEVWGDDSSYYQGHWRDGHPDGAGEYVGTTDSGRPNVWSGEWHQGCFQSGDSTAAITVERSSCNFD